jgi:hypothetical protein
MEHLKTAPQKLCELVDKKYLLFTSRGNTAIKLSLEVLKLKNRYSKVLIQDQGGWLTYPEFIQKLKFEKVELSTDYGLININDLKAYKGSILLINSMPAYSSLEDMEEIYRVAKENNIIVINDASGSVGTDEAKFGDIIIGSFGNAKPIEVGEGGFIATDDAELYKDFCELNIFKPNDEFLDALDKKIDFLQGRLMQFDITRLQVLEDLKTFEIIHPALKGINVIVKFNNEDEKQFILNYCGENSLEFAFCPRYIRVNCPAVSIEIKRIKTQDEEVEETLIEDDEDGIDADKKRDEVE